MILLLLLPFIFFGYGILSGLLYYAFTGKPPLYWFFKPKTGRKP